MSEISLVNKWAIIGLGFISSRHIKAIGEIGDSVLLTCDISRKKRADFTNWQEMLKSERWPEIDCVSICTPNYLHEEMCHACLLAGKKVLCEKPLFLKSANLKNFVHSRKLFTVLQLRHHPEVMTLKQTLSSEKPHRGKMTVRVVRGNSYWRGWKGQDEQSGGILFNLGIHYFDLLIYLFGNKYKVVWSNYSPTQAEGTINFNGSLIDFYLEIMTDNYSNSRMQDRLLEIDGRQYSLSKQDNLSFEDLHTEVFREMKQGRGIKPAEALKSIKLCEELKYGKHPIYLP